METKILPNAKDLEGHTSDSNGLFYPEYEEIKIEEAKELYGWENTLGRIERWAYDPIGRFLRILLQPPYEDPDKQILITVEGGHLIKYYVDDDGVKIRYSTIKKLDVTYEEAWALFPKAKEKFKEKEKND